MTMPSYAKAMGVDEARPSRPFVEAPFGGIDRSEHTLRLARYRRSVAAGDSGGAIRPVLRGRQVASGQRYAAERGKRSRTFGE